MAAVLIDSNVLLDVMTEDAFWFSWSAASLERVADRFRLVINPVVYAEVSVRYSRIEELDIALPKSMFDREPIPYEAAFLAGKSSPPIGDEEDRGRPRSQIFSSARMQPLRAMC